MPDVVLKLFIIGSPGSGKSTVARHIEGTLLKDYKSVLIDDYQILREMFFEDLGDNTKGSRVEAAEHDGFSVLNFTAFDVALQLLEERVVKSIALNETVVASEALFLIIEFARNDYVNAFRQFHSEFLRDAYFIYLDTPVETCKKRIQARVAMPQAKQTEDDYYVPDYIFETYYDLENDESLTDSLEKYCGIDKNRVIVLRNDKRLTPLLQELSIFVRYITNRVKQLGKDNLVTVSESA